MSSFHQPIYYVHIGLPKTATTTIQTFFTMHRTALLERGVLYPKSIANSDVHTELHRLLPAVIDPDSVPWLANLTTNTGNTNVLQLLFEEVARTQAKTVVLSAECISFMRQPEILRDALRPNTVRILVYLRRQDNFLASFYNQLIKSRLYSATFEEFLSQHAGNNIQLSDFRMSLALCDYEKLLNDWVSAFGLENVLVSIFEDHDLPDGILSDMAHKTNIDISGLSPPNENPNPTLTSSMLSFKRRLNQLLSSDAERMISEVLFSSNIAAANKIKLTYEQIELDIRRRKIILERYQEGNYQVAKKFFNGRSLLFKDPSGQDHSLPDFGEKDWDNDQHNIVVQMMARLIEKVSTTK